MFYFKIYAFNTLKYSVNTLPYDSAENLQNEIQQRAIKIQT